MARSRDTTLFACDAIATAALNQQQAAAIILAAELEPAPQRQKVLVMLHSAHTPKHDPAQPAPNLTIAYPRRHELTNGYTDQPQSHG